MTAVIGKGSYGCVSKAKCRITGQLVAIKIMENHTDTEYDTIKILREVLIMKKMNNICREISSKRCMGSFIPQLIDLICLTVDRNYAGPGQGTTSPTRESNSSDSDDEVPDMSLLNQFAIVMDFVDADLDKVFKHNLAFGEQIFPLR